ncbi:Uncharacterized protein DBV15_03660, partial [Temnothorax longispinosus]
MACVQLRETELPPTRAGGSKLYWRPDGKVSRPEKERRFVHMYVYTWLQWGTYSLWVLDWIGLPRQQYKHSKPRCGLTCNAKKVKRVMEGGREEREPASTSYLGCKNNAYTFLPHKTQHPMVQDGATTRPKYHSGDFRWLCSAHHSCGAHGAGEDEGEGGGSMEPAAEGAPLRPPPRARDA